MKHARIPFATQVKIRFEDFDDFVSEYSQDLSLGGMFLKTTRPHPPGSSFEFEFEVEGGEPLIRGAGEVVWSRSAEQAGAGPPGMGIRFVSLDANGRKLLRWLIDHNLAQARATFDREQAEDEETEERS